jgi:hypothetical protein
MIYTEMKWAGFENNATSVTSETALFNTTPKRELETVDSTGNKERDELYSIAAEKRAPISQDEIGKVSNENPTEAAPSTVRDWYSLVEKAVEAIISLVSLISKLIKYVRRVYMCAINDAILDVPN